MELRPPVHGPQERQRAPVGGPAGSAALRQPARLGPGAASQISVRFSSAATSVVVSVYATAPPSGRSAGSAGTAKRWRSSRPMGGRCAGISAP
ncbi:unnamed protein product [[Actinomadura] parvosata subsp. kistnae]|nr:unnamed protein product [Actinomadura parvosata subsp. kistnae]